MSMINDLLSQLEKVETWSSAAIIVAVCIIVGYVLKVIKVFNNNWIPPTVIFLGSVLMLALAPARAADSPWRYWFTRNAGIGLIFGFAAWSLHNWAIYKIDDYLSSKFKVVDKLLNGPPDPTPPDPTPPKNDNTQP